MRRLRFGALDGDWRGKGVGRTFFVEGFGEGVRVRVAFVLEAFAQARSCLLHRGRYLVCSLLAVVQVTTDKS